MLMLGLEAWPVTIDLGLALRAIAMVRLSEGSVDEARSRESALISLEMCAAVRRT